MNFKEILSELRKKKHMLQIYAVFLFIWSFSVLLMPIASAVKDTTRILLVVSGMLFWFGAISTVGIAFYINQCRKRSSKLKKETVEKERIGVLQFFRNKHAKMADIVMFVSGIGFILVRFLKDGSFITFAFLAVFVFSFGMHCMLNGINYKYLQLFIKKEKE